MADLVPIPFATLLRRAHHELRTNRAIFDLPVRKFWIPASGSAGVDLSVPYAGRRALSPIGPAAGPHTQLAQNIALCWLAGGRIIELKTVQVNDRLHLTRPCIDMATVGYNTEWSQELRLDESLREYVKASMLIEVLDAAGVLGGPGGPALFDVSVGYNLSGITSPAVRAWLAAIRDARAIVDDLRQDIAGEFAPFRDLPFTTGIANAVTLSTFHGTPAEDIERIGAFLIGELGFHTVIKLNPPMLGRDRVTHLLHDVLGYTDVEVNPACFDDNLPFDEAVDLIDRLQGVAKACGVTAGIKCGNTLEVVNKGSFLKERVQYLSGAPLHALHVALAAQWRERAGAGLQVSFSAGVDAHNVADCVAAGLVPVTTCTDLLKPGGYGRLSTYLANLEGRMRECGARTIDEFIVRSAGAVTATDCPDTDIDGATGVKQALEPSRQTLDRKMDRERQEQTRVGSRTVSTATSRGKVHFAGLRERDCGTTDGPSAVAILTNTTRLLELALSDERYRAARNERPPRKLGTHLWLWDCLTCGKCIPACPNDAVFEIDVDPFVGEIPVIAVGPDGWRETERKLYRALKATQLVTFADACNDCGNCDVFCPEDGGPNVEKARFFGSIASWLQAAPLPGFVVTREEGELVIRGRFTDGGFTLRHVPFDDVSHFTAAGVAATLDWRTHQVISAAWSGPVPPAGGTDDAGPEAVRVVDLAHYMTLRVLLDACSRTTRVNFVTAALLG